MLVMEVKYLVVAAFASAFFVGALGFVQANHFSTCSPGCNSTVVWWNDTVNVTGIDVAGATMTARIDGKTACTTTASSSGNWNCTFTAPQEIGKYNLSVANGTAADDIVLTVRPGYGEKPTGTAQKFVLETPSAIQEPSGRIRTLLARLVVSRGPPV